VIINVGARPVAPKLPGLDQVPWLDNHRAIDLKALPEHLLILGGGYIGCEFGQMFRRFGAKVTIVDHGPHLVTRSGEDAGKALAEVFRNEGITLELGANVTTVEKTNTGVALLLEGGRRLEGSHLMVAVGRRPNTDDLGCDAAGLQLDDHGFIQVDDHWATSVEGVYAVGDVSGEPQFTHVSWDDHRLLFDVLMHGGARGRSGRHIPYTVFTDPQIAGVGLSEQEAKQQGLRYERATMPFGSIARAIEVDETAGTMELLIDPDSEKILGATLMGAEAGELIHVFVALMQAGASARAIVDAQAVHPTFAEGLQSLVMKLERYALS
jgi:pyruvate/2-oxoglutarate dehydrogenase complex dihydrolipoamide dehydrogenase (E3) component